MVMAHRRCRSGSVSESPEWVGVMVKGEDEGVMAVIMVWGCGVSRLWIERESESKRDLGGGDGGEEREKVWQRQRRLTVSEEIRWAGIQIQDIKG